MRDSLDLLRDAADLLLLLSFGLALWIGGWLIESLEKDDP